MNCFGDLTEKDGIGFDDHYFLLKIADDFF